MKLEENKKNKKKKGRTQSSVLDTLLRLIETASGTNRLGDRVHAMAGGKKEGGKQE